MFFRCLQKQETNRQPDMKWNIDWQKATFAVILISQCVPIHTHTLCRNFHATFQRRQRKTTPLTFCCCCIYTDNKFSNLDSHLLWLVAVFPRCTWKWPLFGCFSRLFSGLLSDRAKRTNVKKNRDNKSIILLDYLLIIVCRWNFYYREINYMRERES